MERAAQIFELVQAFIDGIRALASGNVAAVAKAIEKALVKAIPILIGFLAALVGISGLTGKVQKIIKRVKKRIDKAITKIILKAKKVFGKLFGKKKPKKGTAKKIKEDNKKGKPDEITAKDRKEHKKIANKIERKLKKNGIKKEETFEDFYQRKKKEGEALEDHYQPKLKKGINLDVKFKSLKEDEKDGDMDVTVTIKPNRLDQDLTLAGNSGESNVEVKVGQEISAKYGDRQYRAKIQTVDLQNKKVTYKFDYDNLKNQTETLSFETFNAKVKKGEVNLAPGKEHTEYRPDPATIKTNIKDGVFTLSYDYLPLKEGEKPPSFKASVSMDKGKLMTHVVVGFGLALKKKGSRGVNYAIHSNQDDTHRAHLIADWFRGSAYKEALNIINTSSKYNTGPMKTAEEEIADGIGLIQAEYKDKHITFDMEVDAKYYILTNAITLKAFETHLKKGEKDELYKLLKTNEDPRQTQKVDYVARDFKADGKSIQGKVKARAGKDKWV